MNNDKLNMQSVNGTAINIENIAALFPHCVTESTEGKKIDFDLLKQELASDIVEGNKERYRLEWPGKREAIITANTPINKTLRPVPEDSVDFDTTENIYIEGDNLEVLKLLQESYLGKIKMIYIDPPYNTGKDFVYKDNFAKSSQEELEESGQKDEYGQRLVANPETSGRYHSDWLTMLYPRLKLARNLLTEDGVIFISIDDNEVHNLRKICDEIFGEGNFRNQIVVRRGAKSVQAQFETWDKLGQDIEYILFYTKNVEYRFPKQTKKLLEKKEGSWNNHWRGTDRPSMRYEIFGITPEAGQWRWSEERSKNAIENYNQLLKDLGKDENQITNEIINKYLQSKGENFDLLRLSKNNKPEHYVKATDETLLNSSWYDLLIGSSSEILNLFETKVFDTAKLSEVIKRMLSFCSKDSIILDFFSGSATTAHAVMQLNAEDGGNRKYIMVQVPEATDEKSEAYKAGYKNICEIGKERIRRAAKKIKEDTNADIDYGFRVFRLDTSNVKDVFYTPQGLSQASLDLFADNVKDDRTAEDLVTQIMLDWGLELSLPIERKTIAGKEVYAVAGDSLYCCFDQEIDEAFAKEIAKDQPMRIVFRDNSFKDDTAKENVKQLLKQLTSNTEMRVV